MLQKKKLYAGKAGKLILGVSVLSLGAFFAAPTESYAGFEWTQAPAEPEPAPMQRMPAPGGQMPARQMMAPTAMPDMSAQPVPAVETEDTINNPRAIPMPVIEDVPAVEQAPQPLPDTQPRRSQPVQAIETPLAPMNVDRSPVRLNGASFESSIRKADSETPRTLPEPVISAPVPAPELTPPAELPISAETLNAAPVMEETPMAAPSYPPMETESAPEEMVAPEPVIISEPMVIPEPEAAPAPMAVPVEADIMPMAVTPGVRSNAAEMGVDLSVLGSDDTAEEALAPSVEISPVADTMPEPQEQSVATIEETAPEFIEPAEITAPAPMAVAEEPALVEITETPAPAPQSVSVTTHVKSNAAEMGVRIPVTPDLIADDQHPAPLHVEETAPLPASSETIAVDAPEIVSIPFTDSPPAEPVSEAPEAPEMVIPVAPDAMSAPVAASPRVSRRIDLDDDSQGYTPSFAPPSYVRPSEVTPVASPEPSVIEPVEIESPVIMPDAMEEAETSSDGMEVTMPEEEGLSSSVQDPSTIEAPAPAPASQEPVYVSRAASLRSLEEQQGAVKADNGSFLGKVWPFGKDSADAVNANEAPQPVEQQVVVVESPAEPAPTMPAPDAEAPFEVVAPPAMDMGTTMTKPVKVISNRRELTTSFENRDAIDEGELPDLIVPDKPVSVEGPGLAPEVTVPALSAPEKSSQQNSTPLELSDTEPSEEANFSTVSGFGRELPLVFALSQIIPDEYNYVIAPSVDGHKLISWNGNDRPWPEVLDEAISGIGYDAAILKNFVHIDAPHAQQFSALTPMPHVANAVLDTLTFESNFSIFAMYAQEMLPLSSFENPQPAASAAPPPVSPAPAVVAAPVIAKTIAQPQKPAAAPVETAEMTKPEPMAAVEKPAPVEVLEEAPAPQSVSVTTHVKSNAAEMGVTIPVTAELIVDDQQPAPLDVMAAQVNQPSEEMPLSVEPAVQDVPAPPASAHSGFEDMQDIKAKSQESIPVDMPLNAADATLFSDPYLSTPTDKSSFESFGRVPAQQTPVVQPVAAAPVVAPPDIPLEPVEPAPAAPVAVKEEQTPAVAASPAAQPQSTDVATTNDAPVVAPTPVKAEDIVWNAPRQEPEELPAPAVTEVPEAKAQVSVNEPVESFMSEPIFTADQSVPEAEAAPATDAPLSDQKISYKEPVFDNSRKIGETEAYPTLVQAKESAPRVVEPEIPAAEEIAYAPAIDVEPVSATPLVLMDDEQAEEVFTAQRITEAKKGAFEPRRNQVWRVSRGTNLMDVLADWSNQAGVTLVWAAPEDIKTDTAIWMDSTFEEAVKTLMSSVVRQSGVRGPVANFTRRGVNDLPTLTVEHKINS